MIDTTTVWNPVILAILNGDQEAFEHARKRFIAAIVAATREDIAGEIERVIGGYPGNEATRPKVSTGQFLNDAEWAAKIAREWKAGE